MEPNDDSRLLDGLGGGGGIGGLSPGLEEGVDFGIASLRSISACETSASRSAVRSETKESVLRFREPASSVSSV